MHTSIIVSGLIALGMSFFAGPLIASGDPVVATHPRLLLTPAIKSRLLARRDAGDPFWLRVKERADRLKTYPILQYKFSERTRTAVNSIYYPYQGEGWHSAAMPLALAYQMTGDRSYSDKLLALVDEMIRAQSDPENMFPQGLGPLVLDNYYPTRHLCPVLAIVYDWCYDELSPARRGAIVGLMNTYYDEMRDSAYQRNSYADGNYFVGNLIAAAMMGYASHGDNPRAQEMIDWARMRFDNSPSALIDEAHTPEDFFAQLFEGGTRPQPAREYNGHFVTAAPFKGGHNFQGWAYGFETYNRIIEYMLIVRSATGEDLIAVRGSWLSQILRALKQGLMPNRFEIDPSGDYGSDWGAVISRSLPVHLAYALAGTPDGPFAQHFAYAEIAPNSPYPEFPNDIYHEISRPAEWEDFLFTDTTRPSRELIMPPYYSGFAPVYPQGGPTNGAIPYFYMRSGWDTTATWASIRLGAAFYDDHQHTNAGHLQLKHANDYLLVEASNWKGALGSRGIVGSSLDGSYGGGSFGNTLYFDDYGDFQQDARIETVVTGGQAGSGRDEVVAAEQTDDYSYIRSDLSTAYNRGADTTDQGGRRLEYFHRSFAYLRPANVFVVYDQTKAKASTNPRGEYRKHIRWHFPNIPTISGSSLSMVQRDSRLNMSFLLPESVRLLAVDEMSNPDPCDGIDPDCTPAGLNSGTWRVEVSDASASLTTPFLAVIQPTALAGPAMTTSRVGSDDGKMLGAMMTVPGKGDYVMMFNNGDGQTPAPVTSTTYTISGASTARHTLAGMKPGGRYAVTIVAATVTVIESAGGNITASPAGVLQFGTAVSGVASSGAGISGVVLEASYPNPFTRTTTIGFLLPKGQRITLTLVDALGRVARRLVDTYLDGGRHTIEASAEGLPAGVYSYILSGEGFVRSRRCVVIR